MNDTTLYTIVFIACRLISGKRVASLFDVAAARQVDMEDLNDTGFLAEFDREHRDYVPGFSSECEFTVVSKSGTSLKFFLNERTFIVHIAGTAAYFIGNIQRDAVYLYDHKNALHYRYRIVRCISEDIAPAELKDNRP